MRTLRVDRRRVARRLAVSPEQHDVARRLRLSRASQTGPANPGPILVGELNPYGSAGAHALLDEPRGSSGWRLRMILGLRTDSYLALRRYNLCTERWSLAAARKRADEVRVAHPDRVLVLLGVKVAAAFGFEDPLPFVAGLTTHPRFMVDRSVADIVHHVALLPHPSGRNRAWSEPGAVEKARALMRRMCPELPVGETSETTTEPPT